MKINIIPFAEQICQQHLAVNHIVVRQHGNIEAKFDFQATTRRENIHSATKSIVSMAVGMAIEEGYLTYESRPTEILAAHLPEQYDKNWDQVTLRHLLTMSSGHKVKLLDGYSLVPGKVNRDDLENTDWINVGFSHPLDMKPGEKFIYNNVCPYLITRMLVEVTGENLIDWLRPRLFEPMNVRNPQWLTDPQGYSCGAGGIQLSTEELSRFGQLCLNKGVWNGKQLVPEEYLKAATAKQIETCDEAFKNSGADTASGYGYFFWRTSRDDGYYMVGWGTQLAIVLPSMDACIALTAFEFKSQAVIDLIWEHIVPQLKEFA